MKEKVKSRSKYTCSEIPYDPVEMTGIQPCVVGGGCLKLDLYSDFSKHQAEQLSYDG